MPYINQSYNDNLDNIFKNLRNKLHESCWIMFIFILTLTLTDVSDKPVGFCFMPILAGIVVDVLLSIIKLIINYIRK